MRALLKLILLAALAGCGEAALIPDGPGGSGSGGDTPAGKPWTQTLLIGNFSINSAVVGSAQDGVSLAYIADYVPGEWLPDVTFEIFTLNAYVPTGDGIVTNVVGPSVTVARLDGSSTGEIFWKGEFVEEIDFEGQRYDVYTLHGLFTGSPPVDKTSFANVVYEFGLVYSDASGAELHRRQMTLEVYRRD